MESYQQPENYFPSACGRAGAGVGNGQGISNANIVNLVHQLQETNSSFGILQSHHKKLLEKNQSILQLMDEDREEHKKQIKEFKDQLLAEREEHKMEITWYKNKMIAMEQRHMEEMKEFKELLQQNKIEIASLKETIVVMKQQHAQEIADLRKQYEEELYFRKQEHAKRYKYT